MQDPMLIYVNASRYSASLKVNIEGVKSICPALGGGAGRTSSRGRDSPGDQRQLKFRFVAREVPADVDALRIWESMESTCLW